jgi:hypothetical protein
MKKIFLMVITLAVFAGVSNAGPVDEIKSPTGVGVMKSGSTFKLYYKGAKAGTVKVSIYNNSGELVFNETLKNVESFMRPYNFSGLSEGDYTIAVTNDNGRQIEKIRYWKGKADRFATVKRIAGSDKYVLSVSNKRSNRLTVRIYDGNGTKVYDASENVSGDFAKVYSLSNVDGDVFFEISDSNGIVSTIQY